MVEKITPPIEVIDPNDPLIKAEKLAQTKLEARLFLDLYREIHLSRDRYFLSDASEKYQNFSYQISKGDNLSITINSLQEQQGLGGRKDLLRVLTVRPGENYIPSEKFKAGKIKIILLGDGSIQLEASLKEGGKIINTTTIIGSDSAKDFISNAHSLFLKRKKQFEKASNKKISEDIKNAKRFSQNDIPQNELDDLEQKVLSA